MLLREKKRRRNRFDLADAVHESEHQHVKRPTDTRTQEQIEPAHKFEVILEPDKFTEEKSVTKRDREDLELMLYIQVFSIQELPNGSPSRRAFWRLQKWVQKFPVFRLQTKHSHGERQGKEDRLLPSVLSFGRKIGRFGGTRFVARSRKLGLPAVSTLLLTAGRIDSYRPSYHEDVHDWNFGKLSALREIALSLEDGYRYYYMGM